MIKSVDLSIAIIMIGLIVFSMCLYLLGLKDGLVQGAKICARQCSAYLLSIGCGIPLNSTSVSVFPHA